MLTQTFLAGNQRSTAAGSANIPLPRRPQHPLPRPTLRHSPLIQIIQGKIIILQSVSLSLI